LGSGAGGATSGDLPTKASKTSALLTPRKVAQCGRRVQRFQHPRRAGAYALTESLPEFDTKVM